MVMIACTDPEGGGGSKRVVPPPPPLDFAGYGDYSLLIVKIFGTPILILCYRGWMDAMIACTDPEGGMGVQNPRPHLPKNFHFCFSYISEATRSYICIPFRYYSRPAHSAAGPEWSEVPQLVLQLHIYVQQHRLIRDLCHSLLV